MIQGANSHVEVFGNQMYNSLGHSGPPGLFTSSLNEQNSKSSR